MTKGHTMKTIPLKQTKLVTVAQVKEIFNQSKLVWTKHPDMKKTLIMAAILPNDFEIVVSSSCVMPEMYDEEIGKELCEQKIKDQIWFLLGYELQQSETATLRSCL